MLAYMFPGQGSQFVGMCSEDYQSGEFFTRKVLDEACEILDFDIKKIMFEGPAETLNLTEYTQLGVFLHSYIMLKKRMNDSCPSAVAGHSLGEFTALVAANVITFEDCLKIIQVRASAMRNAGVLNKGIMAAIIGLEINDIYEMCISVKRNGDQACVANINAQDQVVVSGTPNAVNEVINSAGAKGARKIIVLPVSGAFHTSLMEPAIDELRRAIMECEFKHASIPVYMNFDAAAHTIPEKIKPNLLMQLTHPVKWLDLMKNMFESGVDEFVEIGPGNILTGIYKKILRNRQKISIN